ncbi:MAG: CoA pyrophosphatase [Desulfobacteraceae bacterium]|nr:CoA pyrophosphatase [Desulfobacteraceae bacterium]
MEIAEGNGGIGNRLLGDPAALQERVMRVLAERAEWESRCAGEACHEVWTSSVMLLLGLQRTGNGRSPEPCVILNKRSKLVRQAGDLCCPGGTVEGRVDPYLARALELPGFPLSRWPHWRSLRRKRPEEARLLSVYLAAAFRESWEEMRLNPFGIRFLGALPAQCLVLFKRVIHPMVGWVVRQDRFTPSREVDRVVSIPLRRLLDPSRYARYGLIVPRRLEWRFAGRGEREFPCFVFEDAGRTEVLWGVTYRIVTLLLDLTFGFHPPGDLKSLPLVQGTVDDQYVNGGQNPSNGSPAVRRK